mmetsp:Transcript_11171/g.29085  ORF Transcript_11171/g.29085 Transcript_11171/m.29085 type:complete len:244 (-) Transcript_11171:186-917(-)
MPKEPMWPPAAACGKGHHLRHSHGRAAAAQRPRAQIGRVSLTAENRAARAVLPFLCAIRACASKKLGDRNASARAFDSAAFTRRYSSSTPRDASTFGVPAATHSSAVAWAAARSSSCGTTLWTRPTPCASAAVGFHPSSPSIRAAAVSPIKCANWTDEHPSGVRPSAAKGVENVARSDAIIPSPRVADVTDAPIAGPLTAKKSGLGKVRNMSNSAVFCSTSRACSAAGSMNWLTIADRSTPAQ